MVLSMCPSSYMALTAWVTSLATCLVWFISSSLYVSVSERCSKPVSFSKFSKSKLYLEFEKHSLKCYAYLKLELCVILEWRLLQGIFA